MRITAKGQVTIPAEIREKAGLLPHTEVVFEYDGDRVILRRGTSPRGKGRGAVLISQLRGRGDRRMTTDEIMALTRSAPASESEQWRLF